jgi:uncharacterized protein (TIGR01777 family)
MPDAKRVIVTGATGLIGRALCAALQEQGYAVVVLSRHPDAARTSVPGALAYVSWQPEETGPWAEHVDGATAVVHLAGESIFTFGKRQTQSSVRAETHNRVRAIHGLVRAMAEARVRPQVFVSASSVGTYGYAGYSDAEYTEETPAGTDFWGRDSQEWESAALDAGQLGVRAVVLRTGYVLGSGQGSGLVQQAEQFRRGFGGPVRPGTQWVPWVHIADVAGLIVFALDDERVRGPLDVVAPGVVRNKAFAATLGRVVGKPSRFPVPGVLLRLGFGITADTIVHGRRVVPRKALDLGYRFRFPELEPAIRDLLTSGSLSAGGVSPSGVAM